MYGSRSERKPGMDVSECLEQYDTLGSWDVCYDFRCFIVGFGKKPVKPEAFFLCRTYSSLLLRLVLSVYHSCGYHQWDAGHNRYLSGRMASGSLSYVVSVDDSRDISGSSDSADHCPRSVHRTLVCGAGGCFRFSETEFSGACAACYDFRKVRIRFYPAADLKQCDRYHECYQCCRIFLHFRDRALCVSHGISETYTPCDILIGSSGSSIFRWACLLAAGTWKRADHSGRGLYVECSCHEYRIALVLQEAPEGQGQANRQTDSSVVRVRAWLLSSSCCCS